MVGSCRLPRWIGYPPPPWGMFMRCPTDGCENPPRMVVLWQGRRFAHPTVRNPAMLHLPHCSTPLGYNLGVSSSISLLLPVLYHANALCARSGMATEGLDGVFGPRHPIPRGKPQEPRGVVCQVGMMWRVGCAAGQVTAKRCHYEGYPWSRRRSPGSWGCERVRSTSPIPCRVSMWSACPEPSRLRCSDGGIRSA